MKNTTIYTCCNKKYEHFIPIFVHSILYHNNDVDVEIGIEDDFLSEYVEKCLDLIKKNYPNSVINIIKVNFKDELINGKTYPKCPNVIRFINTPTIKNKYVYICDIDIITLQKNITQIHVDDMKNTGLNYSNIVRQNNYNGGAKRLTGLHFSKWESYYPIPNFEDLILSGMFNHDEVFLYNIVKKQNIIHETHTFRPVHGIHASINRNANDDLGWGIKKWKQEWISYRESEDFKELEEIFPEKIKMIIQTIDNTCQITHSQQS